MAYIFSDIFFMYSGGQKSFFHLGTPFIASLLSLPFPPRLIPSSASSWSLTQHLPGILVLLLIALLSIHKKYSKDFVVVDLTLCAILGSWTVRAEAFVVCWCN
eukprot:575837-Hanusia_phi.AAC.2